MTALGKQGEGLLPNWTSPDRGLILRTNLIGRTSDCAAALKNLRWNGVAWTSELMGYKRHRASVFNSGGSFKEFAYHYTNDGVPHFIQQVGKQVQQYDPTANPLTAVESVLFTASTETIPCMRSYSSSRFLYVNGADLPQMWDGTTWSSQPNWPITVGSNTYTLPTLVETFNGRAVYAGFANAPFTYIVSQFGIPNGFDFIGIGVNDPARAVLFNVPSEFGPIVTIKSFRISNATNQEVLLIGCQHGLMFLQGADATSFQQIQETHRFGFVSNRCWMKLDEMALALCTDGVRPFMSNVNFSALSNSALTYPIHPRITAMATDPNQVSQAFVLDNPDELEATWYFPTGGNVHNASGIIMNYSDPSQVRFSDKIYPGETTDTETWHTPACGIRYLGKLYTGGYNGYLRDEYSGNKWNATGIDTLYRSPLIDPPTPSQNASARGFWIECEGPSQWFNASAYFYATMARGNLRRQKSRQVRTFSSNTAGLFTLGSTILGSTTTFGGSIRQQFELDPQGDGKGWEIELAGNTANGDLSLVGIFSTLVGGGTRE